MIYVLYDMKYLKTENTHISSIQPSSLEEDWAYFGLILVGIVRKLTL
jgi:hypothetical protein